MTVCELKIVRTRITQARKNLNSKTNFFLIRNYKLLIKLLLFFKSVFGIKNNFFVPQSGNWD